MSYDNALSKGNTKMDATMGKHPDMKLASFSMPALYTCPNANECKEGCYAQQGRQMFSVVLNAYQENRAMFDDDTLWEQLQGELMVHRVQARRMHKTAYVRIHDSGDFFCQEYLDGWIDLMRLFPEVRFYAYTKMVDMMHSTELPDNFTVVMSYGGLEDRLIEDSDRQAIVVPKDFRLPEGWVDGTEDDWYASQPAFRRIALRYHGHSSKEFQTIL